ncbi:MAG: hypothetical protein ACXVIY_05935 [Mucilaginibacter sp.]
MVIQFIANDTPIGRQDVLYSNLKKAYEHYKGICADYRADPMSYSSVANAVKAALFYQQIATGSNFIKVYITKRRVF